MLNIKRAETYELAKQVAERTGQSMTDAVTEALREKLAKLDDAEEQAVLRDVDAIMELARQYRASFTGKIPTREEIDDEIYDEHGAPR